MYKYKSHEYYIDYECNDYMEEWNFEKWLNRCDVLDATFFNKNHAELFAFVGRNIAPSMLI